MNFLESRLTGKDGWSVRGTESKKCSRSVRGVQHFTRDILEREQKRWQGDRSKNNTRKKCQNGATGISRFKGKKKCPEQWIRKDPY